MSSEFSIKLGEALDALVEYDDAMYAFLTGAGPEPEVPAVVIENLSTLTSMIPSYSGFQSTFSEARMNREVEGLRGLARASLVSELSRSDFYIAAAQYSSDSALRTEQRKPEVQAVIDVMHPNQTGKIST